MSSFLVLRKFNLQKISRYIQSCRNVLPATKSLDTNANNSTNTTSAYKDEWRIMFRMPMIGWASAFNRVKVPYGMLNGFIIPGAFALEQTFLLPPSTALVVSVIGITSWCTLALCSLFTRNVIGIIYINNNNDKLKLAYVDYWGRRQDVCVDLADIKENDKSKQGHYFQSICMYSNPTTSYKLLQRLGCIEDPEAFVFIFGE